MRTSFFGDGLRAFADALLKTEPESGERDWSVDLVYHLAKALIALDHLVEGGTNIVFNKRALVAPKLEEAFRQVLYMRSKRIPRTIMENDIQRAVTLSPDTGKVMLVEGNPPPAAVERINRNSDDQNHSWKRDDRPRYKIKRKRRIYHRPLAK
jgi:hypothetical protein